MWQRIRDYSSAINFTILNFLRRRNYEQFDENGKESCIENSSDESECDEQWTVECNTPHTDTCAIIDHVEVHNFPEKQKSSSERKESNQKNYDADTDVKLDVSVGRSHYKNKVLRGPKDDVNEGIHLVPRDVKDVVHSYTQRRYSRLDDENESSEEEDFQLAQSEPKPMFHNAKDFSGKKSRKTKRRKKMHVYKGLRKIVLSVGKAFVIAHGASLLSAEDLTFSKPTGYSLHGLLFDRYIS